MAYSQQKHFWTWFQHNSESLLRAHKGDKREEEYWVREIQTHLRAFTKKLHPIIVWNDKGTSSLVITAENKTKYFNMAEKFAAKAPLLPGWQIIGLRPPSLAPQEFFEGLAGKAGIDVHKCWFNPPERTTPHGKYLLDVYTEIYTDITGEMYQALDDYIANMLGEKTMGWEIGYIDLASIFERTDEQKQKELIPIQRLPEFITCRNASDFSINDKGELVVR